MVAAVSPAAVPRTRAHQPRWAGRYPITLVLLDASLLAAVAAAWLVASPAQSPAAMLLSLCVLPLWLLALALTRSYELRFLAEGFEELTRVATASVRTALTVGVVAYLGKLPVPRAYLAGVFGTGLLGLLTGRYVARLVLRAGRRRGRWQHQVVVVGAARRVEELVAQLERNPESGFHVVAACVSGRRTPLAVPRVAELRELLDVVRDSGADTVAVTPWPRMRARALGELAYQLEEPGVDLLVAPSLLSVSGERVRIRPVAGLPLLQLQEVPLRGAKAAAKAVLDRALAALTLAALVPALLLLALVVRLDTKGPVLRREIMVGRQRETFVRYTYCTRPPRPDAPGRRVDDLAPTRVGAWLERTGLRSLPVLLNVARGQMSLVGPRPLAPDHRRDEAPVDRVLLVRPGLTGLPQLEGRDVGADEARRLDQHYVDNWSLWLDAYVLLRTARNGLRRALTRRRTPRRTS